MKAITITQHGGPEVLRLADRPIPEPGNQEVLIKVHAAGLNRPDVFQRKGNYPAPPDAPADIPGLEVAGVIEKTGEGVTQWRTGDKVCALVAGGGYAQYVAVKEGQCLPVPAGWDYTGAASLPETVFTVWANVFQRGRLQPGERLLVHGGTSGIGITAVQLARAFDAYVAVTVGSDAKGTRSLELGADAFVNYKAVDFEARFKDEPFNVILDMIGGDYFAKNMNILQQNGRLVYINAMGGPQVILNIPQMMRKGITITGSTLRDKPYLFKSALAAEIRTHVWPVLESGKFKPVIYRALPLAEAAEAHRLLESGEHIGKIVLIV